MPSGARVEVKYNTWSGSDGLLDLYINIPGSLHGKVDGVCGNFNGYQDERDVVNNGHVYGGNYYVYNFDDDDDDERLEDYIENHRYIYINLNATPFNICLI